MSPLAAIMDDSTVQCKSRSYLMHTLHVWSVGGMIQVWPVQQLASHGLFNVMIQAEGDTWIDDHHTNEDIGKQALPP